MMHTTFSNYITKLIRTTVATTALLLFATSCAFLGLGDETDLTAPEIHLTYPAAMSNITNTFTMQGTASDNWGVSRITITISTGQEFQYTAATGWKGRANPAGTWEDVPGAQWDGDTRSATWSLPVTVIHIPNTSEYTITARAYDAADNSSKNSIAESVVSIDTEDPIVTIISPQLNPVYATQVTAANGYALQNSALFSKIINGDITISGTQKDEGILDRLIITLTGETSETIYVKKTLLAATDSLRNWSVTIPASTLPTELQTGKHVIGITTESYDSAQNYEKKDNGFFVYWQEVDTPWIVVPFGEQTYANINNAEIYPGCTLNGQSYDDDGIKSVEIKVYGLVDGSDQTGELIGNNGTVLNFEGPYPTYAAWAVTAPGTKGLYRLTAECTDKNGTKSASVEKFFTIKDINPPNITITAPGAGESIIGDKNLNVTFSGEVDDDGTIADVRMVRIKSGDSNSHLQYLDSKYTGWNTEGSDGNGNKIWKINFTATEQDDGRYKGSFLKTFNLDTDFGINGSELLGNQVFLFRVSDASGSKRIATLSIAGDIEPPKLSLEKITIKRASGGSEEEKELKDKPTIVLKSGDKVCFSGEWSDNTTSHWTDKTKIGAISLLWNGSTPSGCTVTRNTNGTWSTAYFTAPTSSTASITASIVDWGGNKTTAEAGFYLDSSIPKFVRISSTNSDGSYKAGDTITITTEFNKNISFSGGTSNPILELNNNGKTAAYSEGNGTNRHVYTYTVATNDDIADLNVTGITTNGHTWSDTTSGQTVSVTTLTLPSGTNSLAGGRNITIDTEKPKVDAISAVTSGGYYKDGSTIFISVAFTENVTITDTSKLKLKLSSGTTVYATNPTMTDSKTLLFTYTVAANQNASPLEVESLTLNGAVISDIAGNTAGAWSGTQTFTGIVIDTTTPAAPTITGVSAGTTYDAAGKTFYVTGEADARIEYSVDGGSSWKTYTSAVTLSNNGNYTVTARQTDKARNESAQTTPTTFTIDKGNLLTRISSSKPDGAYTTGTVIPIRLYFRKPVTITGTPKLSLTTTPVQQASYTSGSGTSVLTFNYTVQNGDTSSTSLDVTAFNLTGCTIKDSGGTDVSSYVSVPADDSGNRLQDQRAITVVTGKPTVQTIKLNGTDLIITFDRTVYKNSGDITIEQIADDYRVPAVLTPAAYTDFIAKESGIATYYKEDTNGASETGTADLSAKYVLKYEYNTDNAVLIGFFENADARTVMVPIASSNVTIADNVLTVSLTGSYALPVKGAQYTCTLPDLLVSDALSNQNSEYKTEDGALTASGIEAPVIRINKTKETIASGKATQPVTATVKIDCMTPGTTIKYRVVQSTSSTKTLSTTYLPENGDPTIMPRDSATDPSTPTDPKNAGTSYGGEFTVGSTTDTTKGYKCIIRAKASKGTNWSDDAYEAAYRSVIIFNCDKTSGGLNSYWVRGGDSESGGVGTPGFPFNWDTNDYDKVRLMTKGNGNNWYWISWNISTTAYVGFLVGDVPADAETNGPQNWCWGSCSWVSSKLYYPVYPGESITFPTNGMDKINGQGRGGYAFQDKHRESR